MSITHANAQGKTYYRPQGTPKIGKPKSTFLLRRTGQQAITMPANVVIGKTHQA